GKTLTALAKSWNSYGFSNSSFLARAWVLDISTKVDGKRQRTIKAFGKGPEWKAAAVAYAAEHGTQAKSERYRERQTATFRDLWDKFAAHELIGPTPGPSAGRYAGQGYRRCASTTCATWPARSCPRPGSRPSVPRRYSGTRTCELRSRSTPTR